MRGCDAHLNEFVEVGGVVIVKREKPVKQGVEQDSQRPDVCLRSDVGASPNQL